MNKYKLDKDLSKYIGCIVQLTQWSMGEFEKKLLTITSATKTELKTEEGYRIRISWNVGTTFYTVVKKKDYGSIRPWRVTEIWTPEEFYKQ